MTRATSFVTLAIDVSGSVTLDTGLIDSTLVNVISIGISSDVDDTDLTAIGRDGSFLAPAPDDWANGFDRVPLRLELEGEQLEARRRVAYPATCTWRCSRSGG